MQSNAENMPTQIMKQLLSTSLLGTDFLFILDTHGLRVYLPASVP